LAAIRWSMPECRRGHWTDPWPPTGFTNVTNVAVGAMPLVHNHVHRRRGRGRSQRWTHPSCHCVYRPVRRGSRFQDGEQDRRHPDFETAPVGDEPGIVATTLGPDNKPVYRRLDGNRRSPPQSGQLQPMYNDVPGSICRMCWPCRWSTSMDSLFPSDQAQFFFPLDNAGFGDEGQPHNFSFTTEIHTAFQYKGGETFSFSGETTSGCSSTTVGHRSGRATRPRNQESHHRFLGLQKDSIYELAVFTRNAH